MSALPLTLPGERKTCPICERPNVRLATSGLEDVREYRCGDCGARWAVEGRQVPLFDLDGQQELLFGAPEPVGGMLGRLHNMSDRYTRKDAEAAFARLASALGKTWSDRDGKLWKGYYWEPVEDGTLWTREGIENPASAPGHWTTTAFTVAL